MTTESSLSAKLDELRVINAKRAVKPYANNLDVLIRYTVIFYLLRNATRSVIKNLFVSTAPSPA
jgi:hypothetical protein